MELAPLIAGDFAVFDNVETVVFQSRGPDGTIEATFGNVTGLKRAVYGGLTAIGSGGQIMPDVCVWHLDRSTLFVAPRHGDRIVSAVSGTWEIDSRDDLSYGTRYQCPCRKA